MEYISQKLEKILDFFGIKSKESEEERSRIMRDASKEYLELCRMCALMYRNYHPTKSQYLVCR